MVSSPQQTTTAGIVAAYNAAYRRYNAAHARKQAMARVDLAAGVYLSGKSTNFFIPFKPVDYPHHAGNREYHRGALLELALDDGNISWVLKRMGYHGMIGLLKKTYEEQYKTLSGGEREHRDHLKAGFVKQRNDAVENFNRGVSRMEHRQTSKTYLPDELRELLENALPEMSSN